MAKAPDIAPNAGGSPDSPASRGKARSNVTGTIVGALIILVGICLLMYPVASNYLAQLSRSKVIHDNVVTIKQAKPEDLSQYLEDARAYNKRLFAGQPQTTDPFGDSVEEGSKEYRSLLNLNGDNVMCSIHIPSLSVRLPVYHGVAEETLERGAGHLPNTSLPVGGKNTHAVITGHTGLPSAQFFDKIDQMREGDWFIIEVLDKTLAYRVYAIDVVLPEEVSSLSIQKGKDLVTLVTCTPYGVNTHRLLVHAKRCDVPQEWWDTKAHEPDPPSVFVAPDPLWPWAVSGIGIALAVALIASAVRRIVLAKKRNREEQ